MLVTFAFAAASGLGATWFATSRNIGFGNVTVGAWTARPRIGTPDVDPYGRAWLARSGDLPDANVWLALIDGQFQLIGGPPSAAGAQPTSPPPWAGVCQVIVDANTGAALVVRNRPR